MACSCGGLTKRTAPQGWPAITPGGGRLGFLEYRPGGANKCPSFLPSGLVSELQKRKSEIGKLRAAATFIAPFMNVPTMGVGGTAFVASCAALNFVANNCDAGEWSKSEFAEAKLGCEIAAVVLGLAGAAAPLTGIGAPAGPFLVAAAAVSTAQIPIWDALSKGREPRASDWIALGVALASFGALSAGHGELASVFGSSVFDSKVAEKAHKLSSKAEELVANAAKQAEEALAESKTNKAAIKAAKQAALAAKVAAAKALARTKSGAARDAARSRAPAPAAPAPSAPSSSSGSSSALPILAGIALALKVLA